jgi:hypothetical protein
MHRRGAVGLVALSLVGCGRLSTEEQPADQPTTAAPEPVAERPTGEARAAARRYAVVRSGARLYLAPSGDEGFAVPTFDGSHAHRALGVTVAIVGEENGRIPVETIAPVDAHQCAGTFSELADLQLKLFVARADLLPVTTAKVEHRFSDGTSITLVAGVPLDRAETGGEVLVDGARIRVPIPPEVVGDSFEPTAAFRSGGDLGAIELDGRGPRQRYDGVHDLDPIALYWSRFGPLYFAERALDEDTALVTSRGACVEADVRVDRSRLRPRSPTAEPTRIVKTFDPAAAPRVGILGYVQDPSVHSVEPPRSEVSAGALASWIDGRPAGTLQRKRVFTAWPDQRGDRTCFDAKVSEESDARVNVCFAASDVHELDPPPGDAFFVRPAR